MLRRRGRKPGNAAVPVLPFEAGAEALATALNERFPNLGVSQKEASPVVAWLPTGGNKPLPSSPLVAESPEPAGPIALGPWTVSALRLRAEGAVELLATCVGQETLGPGLVAGKDLAFWGSALRFASALATRQQFLPGLAKAGGDWRANWEAVFIGADAERLAKLAKVMPPICRALAAESGAPPSSSAASVLEDFINFVLDHLVRSGHIATWGPEEPAGVREPARPVAAGAQVARWPHEREQRGAGAVGEANRRLAAPHSRDRDSAGKIMLPVGRTS